MSVNESILLGLLKQALNDCDELVALTDTRGQCLFTNRSLAEFTQQNATPPAHVASTLADLLEQPRSRRVQLMAAHGPIEGFLHHRLVSLPNEPEPFHLFTLRRLDSEQSQASLTANGLLSRSGLLELGQRVLQDGEQWLLLLVNIRAFRQINERFGHQTGDAMLQAFARRLQEHTPEHWFAAHLKGPEFALLAPQSELPNQAQLDALVTRLTHTPLECEQAKLNISLRAAATLFPQHAEHIGQLLNQAETTLAEHRSQPTLGVQYFDLQRCDQQHQDIELLAALKNGLETNAFELAYQIQQDARDLDIIGVEALLRFKPNNTDIQVGPGVFIPLLEQSGLIVEVGEYVLFKAAEQAACWRTQHQIDVNISVNISSVQLHAPCFYQRVKRVLEQTGVNPELLELELTESALVTEPDKAEQVLRAIKTLGVKLALDDFGTGYSSLSYLKRFPFDRLKIDQSFVRDLLRDKHDLEIVRAIIAMGKALSLQIIAEGVETAEQRDLLDALGCDLFQGYFIGRPNSAQEVTPLLGTRLL